MFQENVLKWENILTVLIGIAIVASIFLILHRRRKAKYKRLKQEAELLKSNKQMNNKNKTIPH